MKILKIFGLVVGIHVVAFMFVFAIPGCRSTTRHSPPPPEAVQAERIPIPSASPSPVGESYNPVGAGANSPLVDQSLNPATADSAPTVSFPTSTSSTSAQRYNPTRPGTPVAAALQTGPAPEMTPASTYTVLRGDNLWKIAKKNGLSTKELASANNLRHDAPLREGQKLLIPGKATPMSAATTPLTGATGDTLVYKVKAGDSLALIARRAGTTAAAIKSLNHLKKDTVRAGQELTLPAGSSAAAAMASTPDVATTPAAPRSGSVHHVVKSGENLSIIARHFGVTKSELAVANNIADPLKVKPGMDLIIPNPKTPSRRRAGTTPKSPAPQIAPAETTAPSPVSPVGGPAEDNPIAPIAPASGSSTKPAPPEVPVQDVNPVASPHS